MTYTELSLGIVIGIFLSLVVDVAREIIVREYNTIKDNSLRIRSVREDLKAYIKSLCVIWENYKISESMHREFRRDMEHQVREIIDFCTASAKDLDGALVEELRKVCSKFIALIETTSEIDDGAWFEEVKGDGDELCEEFERIVKEKF
ncbi:MAG TPA: hypothetical protein EYP67_03230 [Methanosarcinales archaeon]|nr:hypothetical protein [Methanosarcinales archaeon]